MSHISLSKFNNSTLEKTKVAIKNGQLRDTINIDQKTQYEDQQHKFKKKIYKKAD